MGIAIVTGASSGMGRQFALQIAKKYAPDEIWLIARREDRLNSLAGELGVKSRVIPLDLSNRESIGTVKDLLADENPKVDILINASGFGKYGGSMDLTEDEIDSMINVNDKAVVFMSNAVLPYMDKGSRIITMGSGSSFQPLPFFCMYASTKAFVLSYCRALNYELKEKGITVTCVCPGYVNTEFFAVAKDTANPDACNNFTPLYEPEDVVRKALKDSEKGRDLSVLGLNTKLRRLAGKLLPAKMVMDGWMKMK
ncbi:MAG: SDR family NAD(P)-dependent oxidoreductase [Eubacteriales bacterium]|nr:SDR family NAD(P)-dependent oxidoreductase [Eubacteriales bacterium]